jgi:disulfide oxidoreductase YuzD
LKLQFGDDVEVAHVDLADPAAQEEFSELMAAIEERDLPYPLVAVNDQVRLAGTAHFYRILPLVQEALKTQAVT